MLFFLYRFIFYRIRVLMLILAVSCCSHDVNKGAISILRCRCYSTNDLESDELLAIMVFVRFFACIIYFSPSGHIDKYMLIYDCIPLFYYCIFFCRWSQQIYYILIRFISRLCCVVFFLRRKTLLNLYRIVSIFLFL